ncbi:hypothetical protein, partial [Staphylococcus hominis]|uniref:hypothetical protein n=1 Tax=Staphylococcus hominis TaxID=1290 RepID=UPI0016438D13
PLIKQPQPIPPKLLQSFNITQHKLIQQLQKLIPHPQQHSPTHPPLLLSHIKQPTQIIQPFIQPIQPPYSKQTIPHPQTHQIIIPPHQLITPQIPN